LLIKWGKKLAPNQRVYILPSVPPNNIFDVVGRNELEESLGFELYVLGECADAIQAQHGRSTPPRMVINDSPPHTHYVGLQDVIGDTGATFVRKIAPLMYTSSYKVLDMVFEWIIEQNGVDCPRGFEEKIALIKQLSGLVYPDFLATDMALRSVVT